MTAKKTEKNEEAVSSTLFTKAQLIASERFSGRTDILNALLSDKKKYTVESVEQEIIKYMKGKVN